MWTTRHNADNKRRNYCIFVKTRYCLGGIVFFHNQVRDFYKGIIFKLKQKRVFWQHRLNNLKLANVVTVIMVLIISIWFCIRLDKYSLDVFIIEKRLKYWLTLGKKCTQRKQ